MAASSTRTNKKVSDVTELVADRTLPQLKLESFLPYRLSVLSSVVSRVLASIGARHGLQMTEWIVLMAIGERGHATAKELGARNHMHKTKVSRAVAVLLNRGLMSRQPNQSDRRVVFLQLTPAGKALYEQTASLAVELTARIESAMSPVERDALDRCLAKLAAKSRTLIVDPFQFGGRGNSG